MAFFFPARIVRADNPTTLDTVEIDLWPEYDQPSMLVISHIFISPTTQFPATLNIHIPASAGNPAVVSMRESDGILYNAPYKRVVLGDWSVITIIATNSEIQLKYYDPALAMVGPTHSFSYEWQGDYDVTSLSFEVQQPIDATGMNITPSFGSGMQGKDGITYYDSTVGTIKQGTKFSVFLQYQKDNNALTISALQVQPASPITSYTPGRIPSLNIVLGWILGSLVVMLLIGGGIWYWRRGYIAPYNPSVKNDPTSLKSSVPLKTPLESQAIEGLSCQKCGHPVLEDDIYCRICGTKLRKE